MPTKMSSLLRLLSRPLAFDFAISIPLCLPNGNQAQGKVKRFNFGISSNRRYPMSTDAAAMSEKPVEQVARLLEGTNDDHGGLMVEMTPDPLDPALFAATLKASLSHWRLQGKRGIWIKMPIQIANLVESAVKEGFYFHHAEPDYLMLAQWLPSTPNTLPANVTHRVGIGAFVRNEKNEVLVVQENSGKLRRSGVWKFPTGVVDEGEDIHDAAVREVKEETGIDAKFIEILAFRQSHKAFFEKSDMFFVCMMQPLSFDIQPQESEIEAAQWMPYEECFAQSFFRDNKFLRYIGDICAAKMKNDYSGFSPIDTTAGASESKSHLYLNNHNLNLD